MSSITAISESLATGFDKHSWTALLEDSAREVVEIMLQSELDTRSSSADGVGEVTAIVGLAGSLCAVLSVRCSDAAARAMASKMLGLPMDEVDNESLDALGEIANMVAGNFKAKLDGIGNRCMLSVPTIIVGSDYDTRSLATDKRVAVFCALEGRPICITLEVNE